MRWLCQKVLFYVSFLSYARSIKGITISHSSAARFWSSITPYKLLPVKTNLQYAPYLSAAELNRENLHPLSLQAFVKDSTLHILTPGKHRLVGINPRPFKQMEAVISPHTHCSALPPNSIFKINEILFIVSPQLSFVQLCQKKSLIKVIQLGFQLCGRYNGLRFNPHVSTASIQSFIKSGKPLRGSKLARQALPYIRDNSASPMETACTLLLCLPYKYGGYGIPFPELNKTIPLTYGTRKLTSHDFFIGDLVWQKERLVVEYNSDKFHIDKRSLYNDVQRSNLLDLNGIRTITITRRMLFDVYEFEQTALLIGKTLNHRIKKPKGFYQKQIELRRLLFN